MKRFLAFFLAFAVSHSVLLGQTIPPSTESVSINKATGVVRNTQVTFPAGVLNGGALDPFLTSSVFFKSLATTPSAATFRGLIGLGNVDNTSDLNKPISIATQAALDTIVAGVGGGGTTLTSLTLDTPSVLFNTPVAFATGSSDVSGAITLANAPAGSFFGNGTGASAAPTYMSVSVAKLALGLQNVQNTTLSTWAGSSNITTVGNLTAGTLPFANITGLSGLRLVGNSSASAGNAVAISLASPLQFNGTTLQLSTALPHAVLGNPSNGVAAPSYYLPSDIQIGNGASTTVWASGKTVFTEGTALTGNRALTLPPTTAYPPGQILIFKDAITTGNFGRVLAAGGSDTLTAPVNPPFIAGGINGGASGARIINDAPGSWTLLDTNLGAYAFQDPFDRTKQVLVDLSQQISGVNFTFAPATAGNSVSVVPSTAAAGTFFNSLSSDGQLGSGTIRQTDILPTEYVLLGDTDRLSGDPADDIITSDGSIDSVKVSSGLTQTRTWVFPDAGSYQSGERIVFYDATGAVSTTAYAHVVGVNGNTFNGQPSFDITQPYFSRVFVADPANRNWSIGVSAASGGLAKGNWQTITPASGTVTLPIVAGTAQNSFIVPLSDASTTVAFSGAQAGDNGDLVFVQDTTGGRTVAMPQGVKSPHGQDGGTNGALTLSSAANTEDNFHWTYDGNNYRITSPNLDMRVVPPPAFTTQSDIGGPSTGGSTTQGDVNGGQFVAGSFQACGGTSPGCLGNGTSYTIGRAVMRVWKIGSPTYYGYVSIWTDNGVAPPGDKPLAQVGTESTGVVTSSFSTSEGDVIFTGLNATVTAGTKYWIVCRGNGASRTFTDAATTYRSNADTVFTNGSTTVTSNTAAFVSGDVGSIVTSTTTGVSLPAGTTISSITSTSAVLSAAPTVTSGPITGTLGISSRVLSSNGQASFASADIGAIVTGPNIPTGASISSITDITHAVLDPTHPVTATGSALTVTLGPGNLVNFIRWANYTLAGTTVNRKSQTGTWSSASSSKQMRFTLYK